MIIKVEATNYRKMIGTFYDAYEKKHQCLTGLKKKKHILKGTIQNNQRLVISSRDRIVAAQGLIL
jgi:hypothetical protein